MRKIVFEKGAFEDFTDWATTDRQIYRRIDSEHRLIYKVDQEAVTIIACKYHY